MSESNFETRYQTIVNIYGYIQKNISNLRAAIKLLRANLNEPGVLPQIVNSAAERQKLFIHIQSIISDYDVSTDCGVLWKHVEMFDVHDMMPSWKKFKRLFVGDEQYDTLDTIKKNYPLIQKHYRRLTSVLCEICRQLHDTNELINLLVRLNIVLGEYDIEYF
jgi:hypothetical protein